MHFAKAARCAMASHEGWVACSQVLAYDGCEPVACRNAGCS